MLDSEWAEAAAAGADTQAALNGDPVALFSVLDYVFSQFTGVGIFETFKVLKGADWLGLSWYDNVVGAIINRVSNLDLLEHIGKQNLLKYDKYGDPIYKMYEGTGQEVMDNFAREWGLPTGQRRLDHGNVIMNLYEARKGSDRWTIQLDRSGKISKFRFGKWR